MKLKCNARVSYYVNKYYSLKSNVKKLWQLINSIITVNGIEYYESNEISNHFGRFYSKLGENVVKSISKPKFTPQHYLKKYK